MQSKFTNNSTIPLIKVVQDLVIGNDIIVLFPIPLFALKMAILDCVFVKYIKKI